MFFKHMNLGNSPSSLQMVFNFKMTVCHSCNLRQMRDAEYLMMLSDHCHLFRDFLCSSSTDTSIDLIEDQCLNLISVCKDCL